MTLRHLVMAVAFACSLCLMCEGSAFGWDTSVNGRRTSDMDDGLSVAVDPSTGNVFVGGRRQVTESESRFVVTKFTAAGAKEWQESVEGTRDIGIGIGATALAIDPSGFVIAAGAIGNANSSDDIVITKIDGRSQRKRVIWTRVVDVLGRDDGVNAMTLTPDGGVVVAGFASTASGSLNFYLMKFTATGEDAWPAPQILSGSASNGSNGATAIGVLPSGDVVVTGFLTNVGSNADLFVGRFDGGTGQRRWSAQLNDPRVNGSDFGGALSVAPNGDIIVGGGTQAAFSGSNFTIVRFSGEGTLLWQSVIDRGFFDAARTVAIGPSGDVIAGGTLESPSSGSSFFVVSLDAFGREHWRYETAGASQFLEARAITFDLDGNPVVTGLGKSDVALSAFRIVALNKATGTVMWDVPIVGTAPLMNAGRAIAANPVTGGVVGVGVTQNDRTSFDFTVAHITNGQQDWREQINGRGKRPDRSDAVLAMTVDPRRNSVGLGGYRQSSGANILGTPSEFSVVKVRKDGTVAWKRDLDDPFPHLNNAALAMLVDRSGDFLVAGRTCSTSETSCFTVVRITRTGDEAWRTTIPGVVSGRSEARAIVQDPVDGNIIVAGVRRPPSGNEAAIYKLDANTGAVLWTADGFPGSAYALAMTDRGKVAVAGMIRRNFGVAELDSRDGSLISQGDLAGSGAALSLAFDARDGTVVLAGFVLAGPESNPVVAVAKFDASGDTVWTTSTSERGSPFTLAETVAVDPDTGNIALGGTLNTGQLVFFTMVLSPDGTERWRSDEIPGMAHSVTFAAGKVLAVGEFQEAAANVFAVMAFSEDGAEEWRQSFGPSSGSASAVAVESGTVFAAGRITNNPTGPDMFVVGLPLDR